MEHSYITSDAGRASTGLDERLDCAVRALALSTGMSYLEARSHREIALETGMPLGSVKSAIHRAVGRLRSAMGASE